MFKLIKWITVGGLGAMVVGFVMFGTHAPSYLATVASQFREGVHDQIPIEFELRRAEQLIRDIDPQLAGAKRDVAQAEVDLERVQTEVVRLEQQIDRDEKRLRRTVEGLDGEVANAAFAPTSRRRAEQRLQHAFETHKNNVELLNGKRALIERQENAVFAARERLDAVRAERARLEELVSQLKTQKRQLDALAASRDAKELQLDDTALGRARDVLERVQNRLDVAQKMLESELWVELEPETVADLEPGQDVVAEVRAYFSGSADASTDSSCELRVLR
jgi:chromosome segregation ATPase